MRAKNERAVIFIILATGVASVVTQLLTLREFLALFAGNEFVIAVIFFNWLIAGGAGTMLASRSARSLFRPSFQNLAWLSLLAAAMQPCHLLAIRLLRDMIFIPGSETGFYQTFLYIQATSTPYALLIGFLLPWSLFVRRRTVPDYPGAMVYILDNIGDIAGGLLFSFVLLFIATPLQSIAGSGLLLVAAASPLLTNRRPVSITAVAGIGLTVVFLVAPVFFENHTLKITAGDPAAYRETRTGRLQVEYQAGQHVLFLDGRPIAGSENIQEAEAAAHYPLSQVDDPGHVLVISAVAGIMKEIRKHRPRGIDYVELDPEMAETMFHFGLIEAGDRLNTIHGDARAYLARTDKQYDAIIMCLPEPETYQINRFYTLTFFSRVRQHLTKGGVFAFHLIGFDNYPTEADRQKLSSVHNTAAACFPHVTMLPGDDIFFLCGDRHLTADIPDRLRQKNIQTTYVSNYFAGNITPDRIRYLRNLIDRKAPLNTDIRPRLMRLMFARWFSLFGTSPLLFYGIIGLVLIVYCSYASRGEFILFSTGFANMGTEILTIFAFQIFLGYIYYQIGLIVTVFLAGLLPGAWIGERGRRRPGRTVMLLDGAIILLTGTFAVTVSTVGENLPAVFFFIFGFLFSFACGFQFPTILRMVGDRDKQAGQAFTADLVGAAFGALLTSILLIPYTGLAGTALAIMGLKTTSLILTGAGHDTH